MKKLMLCLMAAGVLLISCLKTDQETESRSMANHTTTVSSASCDTVQMKFGANILPLLSNACYKCHANNGAAAGGVSLATYANIIQLVYNGKLMGTITHSTGYDAMPVGASKLDTCTISKIQAWINRGTPND